MALFSPSFAQYQLSSMAVDLMRDLGMNADQYAAILSAPMIPAILLSLVAGLIADAAGVKRVVGVGLAITALGTCLRLWANSYGALFACMLLSGVGAAMINANGAKLFAGWFDEKRVSAMLGLFMAASSLGMMVALGTTAMLPDRRSAYLASGVLSAVCLAAWLLFMKDSPTAPAASTGYGAASLRMVLKIPAVWHVGIALMALYGCELTLSTFLPTALGTRGLTPIAAGWYSSLVAAGNIAGCIVGPLLARRGKLRPILMACALAAMLLAAFGWRLPQGLPLATALFGAGLFCGALMPLLIGVPVRLPHIGSAYAGTAGGLLATMQLLGAVVLPSRVISPIAGMDMALLFLLGGGCMLITSTMVLFLPEAV